MIAAWLRRCRAGCIKSMLLVVLVLTGNSQADEQKHSIRITKLDGSFESASEVSVDADRRTITVAKQSLSLDDIRRIHFQRASSEPVTNTKSERAKAEIQLRDGSLLVAEKISVSNDTCHFAMPPSEGLKLELDQVAAMKLGNTDLTASKFEAEIARRDRQLDRLFVANGDAVTPLDGYLEALQDGTVRFEWMNETRKLPIDRLRAVVFATGPTGVFKPDRFKVQLRNGSRLNVSSLATSQLKSDSADSYIRVTTRMGATLDIPNSLLSVIESRSSRLMYLSDMKPETEVATTITALPRPWRRDRSVSGRILSAGTETFERGLGIPAGSRLSFRVPERAQVFVATMALDQHHHNGGDCVCVVTVAGQEAARLRLTPTESPHVIRVPCRPSDILEVRVEPAMNLDFGDFTNWCDASFVLASE